MKRAPQRLHYGAAIARPNGATQFVPVCGATKYRSHSTLDPASVSCPTCQRIVARK